jgi:hypothetical protein
MFSRRRRPFRQTTLDALRPADAEDHISALSARAPRQAQLALRVLKQVLSDAKVRGLTRMIERGRELDFGLER